MRTVYTAAVAAALLAAPTAAWADAPPAGYFADVFRSWTLDGCGTGYIGYDRTAGRYVSGPAFCASGLATFGRTAAGYDMWIDLRTTTTAAAAAYGTTYVTDIAPNSYAAFTYAARCGDGPCVTAEGLFPRTVGGASGLVVGFFNTYVGGRDGGGDPSRVELRAVHLGATTYLAGDPFPGTVYASTNLVVTAAPEPATLALTLGGLAVVAGLVGAGARRHRRTA